MTTTMRMLMAAIFVSLVAAGCDCGPRKPGGGSVGVVGIEYDADGTTITSIDGTYDFDKVPMKTDKTMKVTVVNRGLGKLDLDVIEKDMGENVKVGDMIDEPSPVFEMVYSKITLNAGETTTFDVTFHSPDEADQTIKVKQHQASIVLHSLNTEEGKDRSIITFKGTSVSGTCVLPATIDFGAVQVNDTAKQTYPIVNTSQVDAVASVGGITSNSGDDLAFGFAPESITGQTTIPSGAMRELALTFKPTDTRDYLAFVKARAAEECGEPTNIILKGTGVNQVLSCTPSPLDFGYATPGLTVQKELTFTNQGLAPITLTNLATKVGTMLSTEYKLLGANTLMVPGATRVNGTLTPGEAKVQLTFTPSLLGIRQGALTASTTLSQQMMISCGLKGQGGGPDIDIKPAMLNVGRIPYFQGVPQPFFVSRKVTIQNLGTNPTPDDPLAHLYLGKMGASPWWDVEAVGTDSSLNDICVGVFDTMTNTCTNAPPPPPAYTPTVGANGGIKAVAGMGFLDIPIRIQPHDKNLNMEWNIKFYSNDPDEGTVVINVKAQSVELPPCNYSVTPAALTFGLVTPPNYRDLSFQIKNLGQNPNETCLITHLEMKPGSDPIFTLPAGDLDQVELQPGGVQNVTVRAWPMGNASATVQQITGMVSFGISSPTQPQKDVPLTASVATACLTITPSDLDFGTVQHGCSSPRRVFNIYNTCTAPVTVNSYGMLADSRVPQGTGNCTDPMGCPEFVLDGTPGFMAGSVIPSGNSMPVTFAIKYKPRNDGPDTGAFDIKVTQNGQVVDYVVTLRGAGDAMGLNTDTFRQDSKPKADILLVIDDSGSMSDKQAALGNNFASFIRYANSAMVDYHIAVAPTEIGPPAATSGSPRFGKFIGAPNNNMPAASPCAGYSGPKFLTPQTPNVEQQFKNLACVGTSGGWEGMSCVAVTALTAPYITDPNINGVGFLRPDALLAIVAVTDAEDQCPGAATVYENQLRNIKGSQRSNLISYNVIGPFTIQTTGCLWDSTNPDVSKHLYLVNAFNGVKDEICTPNWSTTLENLGKIAFGYRTNFFLTAEPDLSMPWIDVDGPIVVKIDHGDGSGPQKLLKTDPRGAPVWDYDSVSNSVVFQPLYVPAPGDVMTITYKVACLAQ